MTRKELRDHYRTGALTIGRWIEEIGGRDPMPTHAPLRPVPAEFAEYAVTEGGAALRARFSCSSWTITRWRAETGIPAPSNHVRYKPVKCAHPEDFPARAPMMTRRDLAAHYRRSTDTIRRWLSEAGVDAKPAPKLKLVTGRADRQFTPIVTTLRDMSQVGQAVDYLRKFGPVSRCFATGRLDPQGDHWRRGSAILTDAEIIGRARRNGWNPDAWRQVA